MKTFCSCSYLIKIAREAYMGLGEEKSLNSKFHSTHHNLHDSDQKTTPKDLFLLALCPSCTWLALLGVWSRQDSGSQQHCPPSATTLYLVMQLKGAWTIFRARVSQTATGSGGNFRPICF